MKLLSFYSHIAIFAWGLTCLAVAANAGDWPAYRHDAARTSATDEKLAFPLRLAWQYVSPQPPSPAWPDPFRLVNRMDFDYAAQPVIAQGIVCFGSSSDDTVRALDAKTGREKWHFITGGPVRFAPQIENGRVYFASDDGIVYCVDAGSGKLVWKFRAAPHDEQMMGNHRMISRWPVRTGVLVADGMVHCVAGMWPAEGIFIYALAADTGKVLWCNDTVGGTPQGALLASRELLLVPNGNGRTTPLDRRTGAVMQWPSPHGRPGWVAGTYAEKNYMGGLAGRGGTWTMLAGDHEYSFAIHRDGVLRIEPYSMTNGLARPVAGAGVVPQLSIGPRVAPSQTHERGKVSAVVEKGKIYARNAYGIALAGNTLLLGHDGAVVAERVESLTSAEKPFTIKMRSASELWRSEVNGEAREIAVADGRVFVSTHTGAIYCFEPASKGAASALTISDPAAAIRLSVLPFAALKTFATAAFAKMIEQLHQGGMDRGFALVVGDADGKFSTALAAKTQLRVVNALADETAATALREWVLANSTLHGTRVHVQTVKRLDQLPFAQFFANAVIVAGPAPGLSPKELYRVLHPCGGMLLTPGLKTAEAETFLKNSGAIDSEIRQALGGADQADKSVRFTDGFIVRGKLPGALDWDSAVKSDQRVKWPLRPLWFGGPSTRQVQNDVEGAPGPVVANGRYFMRSERVLTAVDAYNGAVLWSRPIPEAWPSIREVDGVLYRVSDAAHGRPDRSRSLRANNENVYLGLGAEFFQGQGEGTIELDARTGEQKKVYGTFNPPAPVVPLKTAQTWPLAVDANQSGVVAMESTSRGLVLTLTTKDTSITRLDAWELLFDFRPVEVRYGLYERGAFHIRVTPAQGEKTPASWSLVTGPEHPKLDVAGTRDAAGTKTTVILPWAELEKWIGAKPASFDFAATLNAHAGGRDEPIVRRHLFGNWAADGINNGWARIVLDDSAPATGSTNAPAIIASMKDLKGAGLGAPGSIHFADKSVQESPGVHPLTGEPVPKVHGIAPVCGAAYCSANVISQSGALYDLADNSGRRSLQGTKTGCTTPQIAALGMMIISEEWGHCICNHPFRTSMALAPAERRLNEDWAQFYDRDVDTRLRQAYVNLGAPGDRRDEKGNLWLGFPRTNEPHTPEDYPNPDHPLPYPVGMRDAQTGLWNRRPIRSALAVPLEVETFAGFGPYRFNADRIPVQGTDRPWIYGSGYRGIRKATLKLNFFKPLASLPAQGAVAIDGKLDEPSWGNDMQSANSPARLLPYTGTRVLFRHDSQNLYVGMQRPPMTVVKRTARVGSIAGFTNEPRPWRVGDSKPDAVTDKDNWWRLIVSSDNGQRAAHFTVTPNGTRAGALYDGTRTNLDLTWKPAWQSAVQTNAQGWALEMAIPWSTLAAAGVQPNRVAVNFLMQDPGAGTEALTYLGMGGCDRCANFTPLGLGKAPAITPRQFTVRLHFAEPDDIKPGQRVFDVKLQNQVVLKGLDVVKEAGGVRTALVREFKNVPATEVMALEFIASGKEPTAASVPILSALEVYDEGFSPPVVAQKQSNQ